MELPQVANYMNLFTDDVPLIDVRAPIEFAQGAFPQARNLPLMNDEERHLVGIRYKEAGQEKAIELGHELVSGNIKQNRIVDWAAFTRAYPRGALYCFRGGLRSKISQQWIYENSGVMYPRITGGYKALRHFLMDELETAALQIKPVILGGRTGTGKTLLLDYIQQQVDLEGIFNHRGSAFGNHLTPQPSQIDIENKLAIAFLKHRHNNTRRLVLEDEAPNIGSRQIPRELFHTMKQSPLVLLEVNINDRIENVFNEYITQSLQEYVSVLGTDEGFEHWADKLSTSLARIERRLGGQCYMELKTILDDALAHHRSASETGHHKVWIRNLLERYYDPMYDYQLGKKSDRVIFRGEQEEVLTYLKEKQNIC